MTHRATRRQADHLCPTISAAKDTTTAPAMARRMTASAQSAAQLDGWAQAGIVRADLAIRRADGAMLWQRDCPLTALPLPWARAHNVKQADVYIRPARGYPWPLIFLDDVALPTAQQIARKYAAVVIHTSPSGGCHLWLPLTTALDERQRYQAQRWLAARVGADFGSLSGEHLGRLAGMKNHKRNGVWVNLLACTNATAPSWDPAPTVPNPLANGDGSAAPCRPVFLTRPSTDNSSHTPPCNVAPSAGAMPSATPATPSQKPSAICADLSLSRGGLWFITPAIRQGRRADFQPLNVDSESRGDFRANSHDENYCPCLSLPARRFVPLRLRR